MLFSVLAKPLYEGTKWVKQEPLVWEQAQQKAFEDIKQALPFEDLEVDLNEMPRSWGYKYLLVLACSYSS